MRELTVNELGMIGGGDDDGVMSGKCWLTMGLNYLGTAGALASFGAGPLIGIAAMGGSLSSWIGWWDDCAGVKTRE